MTYNVFSGKLNPTQSINLKAPVNSALITFSMHRCKSSGCYSLHWQWAVVCRGAVRWQWRAL